MVMEYFTSLALNIASGVLVAVMMGKSRTPRFAQYQGLLKIIICILTL
jgi:hypothetical protein